jgi:superfamily II DNA/RNA helicase
MTQFSDLALDPRVLQAISDAGYTTPTPIQTQAIPHALEGRDVLGIAQTGTGKTAGFVLPMITLLSKGRARARMPRSLVLCPTRELAAQVSENFETYARHLKLSMALLIGGVSFKDQDKLIDRGVDVLIATPGRLLDHFERGKLMLTGVQIMVVDEADRMLDMGFIPDIERIFKLTPFTRQTLFFSATMPPEITKLTDEFLHNPVRVEVARQATTAETIEQVIVKHAPARRDKADSDKREVLRRLIRAEGDALTNAIVFCNRKRDVDVVAKSLKRHGFDAAPLHGDLDQSLRTRILTSFRDRELRLLVASDVAARGLDIPSVSHVFNFDVPIHSEDYVHRIGRTGRAGRLGKAITICLPSDEKYLDRIEELVKKAIPVAESPLGAGDAAEPPVAEGEPAREPRARSRRRSRSEGRGEDRPAPAEVAITADAAPEAAEPVEERQRPEERPLRAHDERHSRGRDERPSRPRGDDRGSRRDEQRRDQRDRGGRSPFPGLGDHVPAFLLRDFGPAVEATRAMSDDEPEAVPAEPVRPVLADRPAAAPVAPEPAAVDASAVADEPPVDALTAPAATEPPAAPLASDAPAAQPIETAGADAEATAEPVTEPVAEAPAKARPVRRRSPTRRAPRKAEAAPAA